MPAPRGRAIFALNRFLSSSYVFSLGEERPLSRAQVEPLRELGVDNQRYRSSHRSILFVVMLIHVPVSDLGNTVRETGRAYPSPLLLPSPSPGCYILPRGAERPDDLLFHCVVLSIGVETDNQACISDVCLLIQPAGVKGPSVNEVVRLIRNCSDLSHVYRVMDFPDARYATTIVMPVDVELDGLKRYQTRAYGWHEYLSGRDLALKFKFPPSHNAEADGAFDQIRLRANAYHNYTLLDNTPIMSLYIFKVSSNHCLLPHNSHHG